MDRINCENDIHKLVTDEFGYEGDVSCDKQGESAVHVYSPENKEDEVTNLFEGRSCMVNKRCLRRRDETVVLQVVVNHKNLERSYAKNLRDTEVYEGKPQF